MALVSSGCGASQTKAPTPSPLPGSVLQRMLAEDADEHQAGAIALVRTDERTWLGAAGAYQDHEAHPGDRFDIGSSDRVRTR